MKSFPNLPFVLDCVSPVRKTYVLYTPHQCPIEVPTDLLSTPIGRTLQHPNENNGREVNLRRPGAYRVYFVTWLKSCGLVIERFGKTSRCPHLRTPPGRIRYSRDRPCARMVYRHVNVGRSKKFEPVSPVGEIVIQRPLALRGLAQVCRISLYRVKR